MQTKGQILFDKSEDLDQDKTSDDQEEEKDQTEEEKVEEALDKGHKDFLKEDAKEAEKNAQKLDDLTEIAEFVLYRTKTTNPFDFFPDEVIVDTNKVSVILKTFFASERVHSVMLGDVSDVFVDTGLFFAKLSIVDKGFVENSVDVEYLSKEEAIKIRRLIQGLVVAKEQKIDFSKLLQNLSREEIIEKVEKLGKARIGD